MKSRQASFEVLLGKVITKIKGDEGDESITFECADGTRYIQYHSQDCCESVRVEDICGEWSDLIGSPILQAEESSNSDETVPEDRQDDAWLWTFYRIATAKGQVVIRWLGTSNGYYSMSVDFEEQV